MQIIRYKIGTEDSRYGWILDNLVGSIEGNIFAEFHRSEPEKNINDIKLLAPVKPSKIICVGRNYPEHAKEHGKEVPDVPLLFLKPPSAIINPGDNIILPPQSQQVEHEAELVVVISKRGRWISPEKANEYIYGYTIGNDVTARDLQQRDLQWTRAKGFDTFCPIGPWIETELDPNNAMITCYVNNEIRQLASVHEMVFNIRQLIAYASSVMTLEPGDVIFTGTPAGVSPLNHKDVVKITIEGIGTLENSVTKEEPH